MGRANPTQVRASYTYSTALLPSDGLSSDARCSDVLPARRNPAFVRSRWSFTAWLFALLAVASACGSRDADGADVPDGDDEAFSPGVDSATAAEPEGLLLDSAWLRKEQYSGREVASAEDLARLEASVVAPAQAPVYEPAAMPPLTAEEWLDVTQRPPYARKGLPEPNEGIQLDPGWADLLGTVAWVIVVVLLVALLIYLLARHSKRPDLSTSKRDYSATDELLSTSADDLAAGLATNLDGRNFREAIRMRFGQVLQTLRQRELLVWVPGNTNREYEAALPSALQPPFAALSAEFSYATYAGREVDEARYERFAAAADDFLEVAHADGVRRPGSGAAVLPSALWPFLLISAVSLASCDDDWERSFDPDEEEPYGMSLLDDLLRVRYPSAEFDVLTAGFGESPHWWYGIDSLPADVTVGDLYVAVGPGLAYDSTEIAALSAFAEAGGRVLLASNELSIELSNVIYPDSCLGDRYSLYGMTDFAEGDTVHTNRGDALALTPVTEYYGSDQAVSRLYDYPSCFPGYNVLLELGTGPSRPDTGHTALDWWEDGGESSGTSPDEEPTGNSTARDDTPGPGPGILTDGTAADDKAYIDSVLARQRRGGGYDGRDGRRALMAEVPRGDGHFLVLSAPVFLSNAYLADTSNRAVAEAILSYLGPELTRVTFDEPRRSSVRAVGLANRPPFDRLYPGEGEGLLREVFKRPALAAAWYLLLGGVLTFVLFGAKRLQRIVPVIQPARNSTLAYLGNVSRLYLARPNNALMARKQLGLFEAFCQRKFGLRPVSEPADRARLAQLRGVDARLVDSIGRYQNGIARDSVLSNDAFLRLTHILRTLYGQLGRRPVVK